MINSDFFERKIGFNDIRTRLKGRCFSTLGTEWVDTNFKFLATFAEVRRALDLHTEFVRLFQEDAADFDADFFDVREPLLRVRPERRLFIICSCRMSADGLPMQSMGSPL